MHRNESNNNIRIYIDIEAIQNRQQALFHAELLAHLFQQYNFDDEKTGVIPKDKPHTVYLSDPGNPSEIIECNVVLAHDFICRERTSHKPKKQALIKADKEKGNIQYRYDAISNGKIRGTGAFSIIKSILLTYKLNPNDNNMSVSICIKKPTLKNNHIIERKLVTKITPYLIKRDGKPNEIGMTISKKEADITTPIKHMRAAPLVHDDNQQSTHLVMADLLGVTLQDIILANQLTVKQRFQILLKLYKKYIKQIRENGIFHRDLKPENIMCYIDKSGNILGLKYFDFNLSRTRDSEESDTLGTPQYIAPEVWLKQRITEAAEVHTLGQLSVEIFGGCARTDEISDSKFTLKDAYDQSFNPPLYNIFSGISERDLSLQEREYLVALFKSNMMLKDPDDRIKLEEAIEILDKIFALNQQRLAELEENERIKANEDKLKEEVKLQSIEDEDEFESKIEPIADITFADVDFEGNEIAYYNQSEDNKIAKVTKPIPEITVVDVDFDSNETAQLDRTKRKNHPQDSDSEYSDSEVSDNETLVRQLSSDDDDEKEPFNGQGIFEKTFEKKRLMPFKPNDNKVSRRISFD